VSSTAVRRVRRPVLSVVAGTLAGLLIIAALVVHAGIVEVLGSFQAVSPAELGIYVGLTACTYFLRALRFRALIGLGARLSKLYAVVSVHTLMVNLLPFSAGDVAYPVLLRRYRLARDLVDGIPSLLLVRVQDLALTAALLVIAVAWLGRAGDAVEVAGAGVLPAMLGVAVVAAAGGLVGGRIRRTALARRIEPSIARIWAAVRAVELRTWVRTLLVGVAARMVAIVAVFYLFRSIGVPLSLGAILLITTLYTLLPLLPLNVVAGIGVTEAYLVASLMAAGVDKPAAIAASLQIHALQLGTALLLAASGFVHLQYVSGRWAAGGADARVAPAADRGKGA
jgi:uncharacterized membrane protein YbhN (UPF0104 family)